MYGWAGRILRVDLSSGGIEKEPLSEELRRNYIGGRGINSRILYQEVKAGINPLDPENRLIFGAGPVSGTLAAGGRLTVTSKSPMTGLFGDANAGGHFSPELKYAGYDHIVFTGKAEKPVYLWIDDDKVELRNAAHLWGKTTEVTDRLIKEELGDSNIHIAYIGPAGENLVRFACVMTDLYGAAGRTGMGAAMGNKNLKAVAVRGTKGVKVAQPEKFREVALRSLQAIRENRTYERNAIYGTTHLFELANKFGTLTYRNARQLGEFPMDELHHETLKKKYSIKKRACSGCIQHCRHWFEVKEGPFAGEKGIGIEWGAIGAWGPTCGNNYAPSIYKLNNLCNQYGLDVINCGEMVALAMDWYDLGLITKEDTNGIELVWGDYEAEIKMCHRIARREGFGSVLADGAVAAAARVGRGAENAMTHSKGMLYTIDDSRNSRAFTLAKAVSTRGADHLRGMGLTGRPTGMTREEVDKVFGPKVRDFAAYEDKAMAVYYSQGIATIADSLELCKYSTEWNGQAMNLKMLAEFLSPLTGIEVDEKELRIIADRIWTVERAFSVREGVGRKDDRLVGREWKEVSPSGPFKGQGHDQQGYDKMLDDYYDLVGWDKQTGVPTRDKLEVLGLHDIAVELASLGKL